MPGTQTILTIYKEVYQVRIAIGQVAHETNTFSNVKTTTDLFKSYEWVYGDEILNKHQGVRNYLGGMIDKAVEDHVEIVPTFSTYCNPSGSITKEALETIRDELISTIQSAGELDAICLALHGAGVAEGYTDIEGEILRALRQEVGCDIPIVASLDLHGNVTETMVKEADALFGVNYYPHTDSYDRGLEAMDMAIKMVKGEVKPTMSLIKLPLLLFFTTTYDSPEKDINALCWDWEKKESVLDCTFFHGFVRADIPEIGASVLAITDGDQELANDIAENVANKVWEQRENFIRKFLTPKEGIAEALKIEGKPIVINEASDNPGSGTPGDGTILLEEMIEANMSHTCFGFIYDPEVTEVAHRAGIGATINVELGGKTDSMHGRPLSINAYVKSITDGRFTQTSPVSKGAQVNLGKSARLQVRNVDVIVCSVKTQTLDEQVFLLHGIDVMTYKIVALKSCQHFRAAFLPIAEDIITVDSPGLSTSSAEYFTYKHIPSPIYPLDAETTFHPRHQVIK